MRTALVHLWAVIPTPLMRKQLTATVAASAATMEMSIQVAVETTEPADTAAALIEEALRGVVHGLAGPAADTAAALALAAEVQP